MSDIEDAKFRVLNAVRQAVETSGHLVVGTEEKVDEEFLTAIGHEYAKAKGIDKIDPNYVVIVTLPSHVEVRFRPETPLKFIEVTFSVGEPTDG